MGVHQLWCHKSHRNKSIARQLVDAARHKLVYGMVVPHSLVAFSSPTADGAAFARRYAVGDDTNGNVGIGGNGGNGGNGNGIGGNGSGNGSGNGGNGPVLPLVYDCR